MPYNSYHCLESGFLRNKLWDKDLWVESLWGVPSVSAPGEWKPGPWARWTAGPRGSGDLESRCLEARWPTFRFSAGTRLQTRADCGGRVLALHRAALSIWRGWAPWSQGPQGRAPQQRVYECSSETGFKSQCDRRWSSCSCLLKALRSLQSFITNVQLTGYTPGANTDSPAQELSGWGRAEGRLVHYPVRQASAAVSVCTKHEEGREVCSPFLYLQARPFLVPRSPEKTPPLSLWEHVLGTPFS